MSNETDKRFFIADDGGATWSVVARDRDHAIEVLRGIDATWEADINHEDERRDLNIDQALKHEVVELREMTADEVTRRKRCHTEDDLRGVIPLSEGRIGDAFCSEW